MQKLSILFVALFLSLSLSSFGQQTANTPHIIVTLGNIIPTFVDGKQVNPVATREEILANPILMTPPPPCDILSFSFRMLPFGEKKIMEPINVTGAQLTPQIIKMIRDLKDPQARIFIDNINVKCGDREMKATPILLNMVLNKK